jgi:hypothetical protein
MLLFDGKVDLTNDGLPGVREVVKLTLLFSGLDPNQRYKFCGTVARGGNYPHRWSVFTITGVQNFVAAHMDGSTNQNIFTAATYPPAAADLLPNQVALNSGHNLQGSVVCWENIQPEVDGTMRIEALRYLGPTPFGNAADPGTAYAYGFEAFYLAEFPPTGNLIITENPVSQRAAAGRTASFRVTATSPDPITYQWRKAPPGSNTFADVPGATSNTYVTPVLTVGDDGARFQCVVSSGGNQAISAEATLGVDGIIPRVVSARGSVNYNRVFVTFSEPMKLDQLATPSNYGLSGGVAINSAVALDSRNVSLLTATLSPAIEYTVTVNNVEDEVGNPVPAGSTARFTSYSRTRGAVGLEIWDNLGGGLVADLKSNFRYPLEYDVDFSIPTFDSLLIRPDSTINIYGARMRAYLVPSESAEYEFFIRADDSGELRLELFESDFTFIDDDTVNFPIAVATAGGTFQESGSPATSFPILLEAGRRYPMQAIFKESNGADYCQIAWRKVGDLTPADQLQPIPAGFLEYEGLATPAPEITRIALENGQIVIQWKGSALEATPDFRNWAGVSTNPLVPYTETPNGFRFFRSRR